MTETRPRESVDVVVRKFFRSVQEGGILADAKKQRFRQDKELSRRLKRTIAIRKANRKRQLRGW